MFDFYFRSQYSPIGFKLAEGGSSTVAQVPRLPQHRVFDEPKTFRYMEHDQMIPGYLVAVMNFTIVSVSPRGDIEYIFALKNAILLPQYKSKLSYYRFVNVNQAKGVMYSCITILSTTS